MRRGCNKDARFEVVYSVRSWMFIDREPINIPAPFGGRNDTGRVPVMLTSALPTAAEVGGSSGL